MKQELSRSCGNQFRVRSGFQDLRFANVFLVFVKARNYTDSGDLSQPSRRTAWRGTTGKSGQAVLIAIRLNAGDSRADAIIVRIRLVRRPQTISALRFGIDQH